MGKEVVAQHRMCIPYQVHMTGKYVDLDEHIYIAESINQ